MTALARRPQEVSGRVPPNDQHAERAVIGGLMLAPDAWTAASLLKPADFYSDKHGIIFEAICALVLAGEPVDTTTLRSKLAQSGALPRIGGEEYLLALTDTIPTVANIEAHARIIREKAVVRRLIHSCYEIAALGYGDYGELEDFVDLAETNVRRACDSAALRRSEVVTFAEASHRQYGVLHARHTRGETSIGYATGLDLLDDATGGMVPGDLIICGARPGMGKTALSNEIKLGVALSSQKPVLSFELEMTEEQLVHRLWSARSEIPMRLIRSAAQLQRHDFDKILATSRKLGDLGLNFVFQRGLTIEEITRVSHRAAREHGGELGLIVVDYLQRVQPTDRRVSRDQQLGEVARDLKTLAGDLRCPVLAVSALNRDLERRDDKRPVMSDLRSSGEIESEADTILFLYREEVYKPNTPKRGTAEVILGKQRSGDTGDSIELKFTKELTRFENLIRNRHDRGLFEDDVPPPDETDRRYP